MINHLEFLHLPPYLLWRKWPLLTPIQRRTTTTIVPLTAYMGCMGTGRVLRLIHAKPSINGPDNQHLIHIKLTILLYKLRLRHEMHAIF